MKPFALLTTLLLLLTGCTGLPKGIEPVTGFDQGRYLAQKDHHTRPGVREVLRGCRSICSRAPF